MSSSWWNSARQKTGTLTHGEATVTEIRTADGFAVEDVLRLAASLDQASGHVVAAALIKDALAKGISLSPPANVVELSGAGIEGTVDGKRVVVGGTRFVETRSVPGNTSALRTGLRPESMTVSVAIGGKTAGVIVLRDTIRSDAKTALSALRKAGIARIVLASGDRAEIARSVGEELGVDEILGDLSAEAKVAAVRREAVAGPVIMVGDDVNDAPALAAADVGVAMGTRGTTASSEAAGVVLLVDQLEPLAKAIVIAKHTEISRFKASSLASGCRSLP